MALSSENYKNIYAGDDTSTVFPYTFKIFDQAHIEVIKYTIADGTETVLTLGTHYTVSGVGADAGGNVTLLSPLLDEFDLIIRRKMEYKQGVDWEQNGDFSTDVLEKVEDSAIMLILQLKERIDRAILQDATKSTPLTIPVPAPGKAIKWNPAGTGFTNTDVDIDTAIAAAAASAAAALVSQNAAAASASGALSSKNSADADAVQTAADRVQTGLDKVATAADRVQTGLDKIATAADRVQTGLDKTAADGDAVATAADRVQTGLDRTATGQDKIATAADRVQTGLDKTAAEAARDLAAAYAASAAGIPIATAGGTVDAITADYTPDISLLNLTLCSFVATGANTSTTPTFAPDGLTAHTIVKKGGQALAAGDIPAAGFVAILEYNLANTRWELLNPAAGGTDEKVKNVSGDASAGYLAEKLAALYPSLYQRDQKWVLKTPYSTAANRYTILTPNKLSVDINGTVYFLTSQAEIDLSLEASWDTIAGTDYRTAANRAGVNFYIYACVPGSGSAPTIKVSANSTTPSGYSASTSRKIGGFHGLCVAVGTISGHTLTDFAAGDVLPASIWDLLHRPVSNPEGMVFSEGINKWVDIYLASGTGSSTASAYGGTISDTRNWSDFADDGAAVKKRMLEDDEFQVVAAGSNEETNINGNADPGTTGGHVDSASRRMISNIGVEDACGVINQWLRTQTYFPYGSTGYWGNLPGGKGSVYTTFSADPGASEVDNSDSGGDIKLFAGGSWSNAAYAGSRSRNANYCRWITDTYIGCRFCAEPV